MKNQKLAPDSIEKDKVTKKHNTAPTSAESYQITNATGQRLREKKVVLETISKFQPVTSRMVTRLTGIERTNITRSLFDLVHDSPPLIKEAFIKKCPETLRRVKWYTLQEWPQMQLFTSK